MTCRLKEVTDANDEAHPLGVGKKQDFLRDMLLTNFVGFFSFIDAYVVSR